MQVQPPKCYECAKANRPLVQKGKFGCSQYSEIPKEIVFESKPCKYFKQGGRQ